MRNKGARLILARLIPEWPESPPLFPAASHVDKAEHVKQSFLRKFRITNVIADLTN